MKKSEMVIMIRIKVQVSFWDSFKMRLMGSHPSAIIARAIGERIKKS